MKRAIAILLLLPALLALPVTASTKEDEAVQPIVVVNNDNSASTLTKHQLQQLYFAKIREWPSGDRVILYMNTSDRRLLESFMKLLDTTIASFTKRWIKISLSGEAPPPREVSSDQEMANAIKKHKGAIGFVRAAPDGVRKVKIQ